jgi:hypothetical protein
VTVPDIDYTGRVAELLTEHLACAWDDERMACGMPLPEEHGYATFTAAHLAEVLAAAGLIPTRTEWGLSWRGVPQQSLGGPLTEDEARLRTDPVRGFALISRPAHDWKDATDD